MIALKCLPWVRAKPFVNGRGSNGSSYERGMARGGSRSVPTGIEKGASCDLPIFILRLKIFYIWGAGFCTSPKVAIHERFSKTFSMLCFA